MNQIPPLLAQKLQIGLPKHEKRKSELELHATMEVDSKLPLLGLVLVNLNALARPLEAECLLAIGSVQVHFCDDSHHLCGEASDECGSW